MRKVLQVKKMNYIFHTAYEGKLGQMTPHYKKIAHRTTQTFKFMQSARLLRIIEYDPTLYIKMSRINHLTKVDLAQPLLKPVLSK